MDRLTGILSTAFVLSLVLIPVSGNQAEEITVETQYGAVKGTRRHGSVKLPGGKNSFFTF